MAYYGINFRADSAYVTDGAGETYTIGAAYPETRGGITFGYSSGANFSGSRDRDNTNDRRIAGLVYSLNSSAADVFQVDLPEGAGTYDIAIALGDAASARGNQLLLIKDGSTTLATIGPTSTSAADRFIDATGVERTDAAWPGSMALLRLTFSGSVMNLHIGNGGGGDVTCMCHVGWTKVASSSTDQAASRFVNDDGSESGSSFKAAQNVNVTMAPAASARIRFLLQAAGDPAAATYQLEYRKVGDTAWTKVST